ncbi:hypothetical protein [Brevibacillus migulae]|uniref:hypothetical protein n=1 Tax=Brevibacillus migulae TaxID=1644114 RepID=UPI00106EE5F6|nr:hypothetical protein [Brevibacillus migulae]
MLAQEMGTILTKHADCMTAKHWTEIVQQLESKGLYVVIETDTNGKMMSPFGGLMPMPCKKETFSILTEEELAAKGLPVGHHILTKAKEKVATL